MESLRLGKVYKIVDPTESKCYIGSTCEKYLSNRLGAHSTNYRKWKNEGVGNKCTSYDLFEEFGLENCKIVLVETFSYRSSDELKAREAFWIKHYPNAVNKNVPGRTKAESQKAYVEKNAEKLAEYRKEYRKLNDEKIKAYQKEYREKCKAQKLVEKIISPEKSIEISA